MACASCAKRKAKLKALAAQALEKLGVKPSEPPKATQ